MTPPENGPEPRRRATLKGGRAAALPWRLALAGVLIAAIVWLAAGCTDVRPTIKIGLIAPFEGLERRSGYAALDAVRAAIAGYPDVQVGILPLALDGGSTPEQTARAAQKLLVDPRVKAIVGPLDPALGPAVAAVLPGSHAQWFPAYAPPKDGHDWAAGLVQGVAGFAAKQGAKALVLAGWTAGWPNLAPDAWSKIAGLPVRLENDPAAVHGDDAVLWLGGAADGAAYLRRLRERLSQVPFWLGAAGADPVFAERAGRLDSVYWAIWTDTGYTSWAETNASTSPALYLVYAATRAALSAATGHPILADPAAWQVRAFTFSTHGEPIPYSP